MSKKKGITTLSAEDLPEMLKEGLEEFIKGTLGKKKTKRKEVPLVTINPKDLYKFLKLKAEAQAVKAALTGLTEGLKDIDRKRSDWWEYIQDKYKLGEKNLTIDTETGVISEVFEEEESSLELVKDKPLN